MWVELLSIGLVDWAKAGVARMAANAAAVRACLIITFPPVENKRTAHARRRLKRQRAS
jgi:hypothetical protein